MRLDVFLANSGRIPRRTQAKQACDRGLVVVEGKPAKAATPVEVGQKITVRTGMSIRVYCILALPLHPVPRDQREAYTVLLSSESAANRGD